MSELKTRASALIKRLLDAATKTHSKLFAETHDGGVIEIKICKKWKTLEWKNEKGQCCFELFGKLDEGMPCSCGADQHNKESLSIAQELEALLAPNEKAHRSALESGVERKENHE